jgi:hypothetical protein
LDQLPLAWHRKMIFVIGGRIGAILCDLVLEGG